MADAVIYPVDKIVNTVYLSFFSMDVIKYNGAHVV